LTAKHELVFEGLIKDRKFTAALPFKLYAISILTSVTQKH